MNKLWWRILAILGAALVVSALYVYANAAAVSQFLSTGIFSQSSRISGFDRISLPNASEAYMDEAFLWKSILQSEPHPSDQGQVYLSLNPATDSGLPTIWNVTKNEFTPVDRPDNLVAPWDISARVTFLGAFSGGLAPVSVENVSSTNFTLWGYVDIQGKWVVPPQYLHANPFVGEVAVVAKAEGDFILIDRKGVEQRPWEKAQTRQIPQQFNTIKTEHTGRWTSLTHKGKWVVFGEGKASGEPTYLNDGVQTISVPGIAVSHSIDGELWLLHTAEGTRLWKPSSNEYVKLPDNLTVWQPIAANLFTAPSRTSQSAALYSIDGLLIADPSPIVKALTPQRFIACDGGYSPSLTEVTELGRNIGPDLPNHHCGIMDEKGQWWAKPVHQMIDSWGEHEVRLQAEGNACIADLRNATAPDCTAPTPPATPVPLLNINSFPRQYAYQTADRRVATPYQYSIAYPYLGQVAAVFDEFGFPGLIDQAGYWLTPRPTGDTITETHLRATIVQSPYRNRAPAGTGLIDRAGVWVIPPVFNHIGRYPDGSLQACQFVLRYVGSCVHLDVSGKPLPPTAEQTLDSINWVLPEKNVASTLPASAVATAKPVGKPQPVAVALNGRWGFQDSQSKWVIEPKFDDAEDFVDDRARVGVFPTANDGSVDDEEDSKALRWGVIDLSGAWVEEPRFTSADSADDQAEDGGSKTPNTASCCVSDGEIVTRTGDRYVLAKKKNAEGAYVFGYLTQDGKWTINPSFLYASPFVGDVAAAKSKLPELPEVLRKRWVTISVQPLAQAHVFTVKAEHPGAADEKAGRIALIDDAGRWLLPVRKPFSSLSKKN
jgi:hypothetical protein